MFYDVSKDISCRSSTYIKNEYCFCGDILELVNSEILGSETARRPLLSLCMHASAAPRTQEGTIFCLELNLHTVGGGGGINFRLGTTCTKVETAGFFSTMARVGQLK